MKTYKLKIENCNGAIEQYENQINNICNIAKDIDSLCSMVSDLLKRTGWFVGRGGSHVWIKRSRQEERIAIITEN